MPSADGVRRYWASQLVKLGKFDSITEAAEPGSCFACGFHDALERAHIVARSDGGPDEVGNLHLLCRPCHRSSEGLSGETYWSWLASRTYVDVLLQEAAQRGVNLAVLLR